jgi:hypothetical protein
MENKLELKHLASYLPYGVKVMRPDNKTILEVKGIVFGDRLVFFENSKETYGDLTKCKPLLRPLSQLNLFIDELENIFDTLGYDNYSIEFIAKYPERLPYEIVQWLLSKHFDIYVLIDKKLAIKLK